MVLSGWTAQGRRRGVLEGDQLVGGGAVAAFVGGDPGAGDHPGDTAVGLNRIVEDYGNGAARILAVAKPVLLVEMSPGHSRTTSAGAVTLGGVVSRTVMVWRVRAELLHSSVATQVRVMTLDPPQPDHLCR